MCLKVSLSLKNVPLLFMCVELCEKTARMLFVHYRYAHKSLFYDNLIVVGLNLRLVNCTL